MSKVNLPSKLDGKTVLVAGAAGFVLCLCEFYLGLGAKIIGLDNFITGSRSTAELLSKNINFEFHECNIFEQLPIFQK